MDKSRQGVRHGMARRDRTRLPAAQRREQIIAVATRLVAERGFWGLSMHDVAAGCGLTVPGLLHHVGSKDGLLVAVLEHRDDADGRALETVLGGREPDLPELCAAIVRRNAAQPEIVRLFAVLEAESLAPDHPAHAYFAARQQRILEILTGRAKGVSDEPEVLARQIIALMDGLQLQWLRSPGTDLVTLWSAASRALFACTG